jgi:hypothetical protein
VDGKDFAQPIDQRVCTHTPYEGPTTRAAHGTNHRERRARIDSTRIAHRSSLTRRVGATTACIALGALVGCAPAWAVTVDEPTIIGPLSPVHHVEHGGFDGGYDWVAAQGFGEPQVDGATWEAEPLTPGDYSVEAWIPNEFGTADARYEVHHDALTSEVLISQYEVESGAWIKLGAYEFAEAGASVSSTDAAGDPGDRIDWSDMRWTAIAAIPPNLETAGSTTTVREPSISGSETFVSRFAGVGYGESLWVGSAQGQSGAVVNTATWSAPLAAGEYDVDVYIPETHREAEVGYSIHAAAGNSTVVISQPDYANTWVDLGTFRFAGGTAEVTSPDNTGEPEQDIAWNALRFIALPPSTGTSEKTVEPPNTVAPTSGDPTTGGGGGGGTPTGSDGAGAGGSGASTTTGEKTPHRSIKATTKRLTPLVPAQDKHKLVAFTTLRVHSGPHDSRLGPADIYSITALHPSSKALRLHYKCEPCLLIPDPLKLRHDSQEPETRPSNAEGNLRNFLNQPFYEGTVLQVEVREPHHRSLRYTYHFLVSGKRPPPTVCALAATSPIEACAP